MPNEYTVVIERAEEGYYIGNVPVLPGCHTRAKTVDQPSERMKEAIEVCIEDYGDASEKVLSAS